MGESLWVVRVAQWVGGGAKSYKNIIVKAQNDGAAREKMATPMWMMSGDGVSAKIESIERAYMVE